MNFYEEKQQRKLERYEELASKNHAKSEATSKHARDLADVIPFGQPILVGHHSENADRNYRKRIDNTFRRSIEENSKAEHYDNKAHNILHPTGISSDDPEAIQKLKLKLIKMEEERKEIKLREHHGWELSNLSQNLRSVKLRIQHLESVNSIEESKITKNNVTLIVDKEENRVKLEFPGKPSEEVRTKLKRNGFHWSPYNKAWQRMISDWSIQLAKEIQEEFK